MDRSPSGTLRLLSGLARALPPALDGAIAAAAAGIVDAIRPQRQAGARANAAALFPEADARRLARSAGRAYARFLIEYLREMGRGNPNDTARNRFSPDPSIQPALDQGRGLVMCTAHLGNWELGAQALVGFGRPIVIIAEEQYTAAWRDGVEGAKRAGGIEVVPPTASPRTLIRRLKEGFVLGLLVDGAAFSLGRPARIAGHETAFPSGPARLAALSGAVMAGGTCFRTAPDRFVTAIRPLAGTERAPVGDHELLHAAVAQWLESELLAHPGAWCIFRPFFEAAPDAARLPALRAAWESE